MLTDSLPRHAPSARRPTSLKVTSANDFLRAKTEGVKLSMITCYDYTFARLLATSAVDAILVGDSAGMVMHGHRSTLSMTVDLIRLHTEAVVRGAPEKFIVADMPFLSFRKGPSAAIDTVQILAGAGAHAVKLEGIDGHEDVVERIAQSGVPVMGHVGLQPQSVRAYGGFRVQGRSVNAARDILRQASTLEALGAFAVILECIPARLLRRSRLLFAFLPSESVPVANATARYSFCRISSALISIFIRNFFVPFATERAPCWMRSRVLTER